MPHLQVIARHTMAPGSEEELLALYPQLVEASRAEPGNVSFVAYRQLDDPREIVLLERFESRDAFAAHRESEHFKDLLLGRIAPRLEDRVVELIDLPAA